jgi:hypothetical protein
MCAYLDTGQNYAISNKLYHLRGSTKGGFS